MSLVVFASSLLFLVAVVLENYFTPGVLRQRSSRPAAHKKNHRTHLVRKDLKSNFCLKKDVLRVAPWPVVEALQSRDGGPPDFGPPLFSGEL